MQDTVKVIKKAKQSPEVAEMRMERTPAPTFQAIYTNNVQISISYFDIAISLGQVTGASAELVRVADLAKIYLTPEHAASLHSLLGQQLQRYRETFGELRPEPKA